MSIALPEDGITDADKRGVAKRSNRHDRSSKSSGETGGTQQCRGALATRRTRREPLACGADRRLVAKIRGAVSQPAHLPLAVRPRNRSSDLVNRGPCGLAVGVTGDSDDSLAERRARRLSGK